ncbi:MAG TPA: peptidoglycan DD-metalloendopeptidase family protein [Marmoricola sp.]|nr:peptidoglycan DD-metalloendopeptidase family protein [Marmoricola sp.]
MNHRSRLALMSGALLAILAFAVVVVAMLMTITGQSADAPASSCSPGEVVSVANTMSSAGSSAVQAGLSSVQAGNVQTIVAEGYQLDVPREGIVIALAVARQESNFTNYANDGKGSDLALFQHGIEASLDLPHEGVASDHGSLGVFQQQWPWWGTIGDLMTPATAAGKFYKALLAVPGWQSMTPTEAGQAVQHSAYPDAYADDVPFAERLLAHLGPGTQTGCAPGAVDVGTVVEPLASGVQFTDLHNFGDHGGHWSRGHTGTDLSAPCRSPVVAATNGTVEIRTDQSWAGPWLVEVSTGPGRLTTWYAHMRAIDVQAGDQVSAGQQLGEVGDLGNATGCHLHFEVHPHGGDMYADEVDPSAWLAQNVGHEQPGWQPVSSTSDTFTVATFNTLGSSHTTSSGKEPAKGSGPQRTVGVLELLNQYDVDVVGLQEFQRPQYNEFTRLAGSDYELFSADGDTENAIAWNPTRFRLVSSGTFPVPYFGGHTRQMPIVQLEDQRTGQHAIFVNVHNPADTMRFPNQGIYRAEAIQREIAMIGRLEQQLGLPVILTGDLNDRHDAFCALGQALSINSAGGGSAEPCRPPPNAGIDWILGTHGVQFSAYQRDESDLAQRTSDHPFVVARASVGNAP